MLIAFYTLGCKVNQYETQAMMRLMEQQGCDTVEYTPGMELPEECAVVVNSCTVTGESDRKLRQLLHRTRRENPHAILVLTGCMPQAFPEIADTYHQVDIVLGNAARHVLPERIHQFLTLGQRIVDIPEHDKKFEAMEIDEFQGHTRAFVKIQDGCNRFCSYCIIPYARGRVRSKPLDDLRHELTVLASRGYREAVLVGINLTAYGQDLGLSIADAVETACGVEGIERVRLGSLEPDMMTDEVIARMQKQPKLCPQFHLALQSGCDDTLKRMNRHYTTTEFAEVSARLRRAFPGCALTTDVMVGFPGETEDEFARSMAFIQQIGFAKVHVFPYSRRAGTPADRAPLQIPSKEKAHRSHAMIEACERSRHTYMESFVGRVQPVLLETTHESGLTEGYTPYYVPVRVATRHVSGETISVRITGVRDSACVGESVQE